MSSIVPCFGYGTNISHEKFLLTWNMGDRTKQVRIQVKAKLSIAYGRLKTLSPARCRKKYSFAQTSIKKFGDNFQPVKFWPKFEAVTNIHIL